MSHASKVHAGALSVLLVLWNLDLVSRLDSSATQAANAALRESTVTWAGARTLRHADSKGKVVDRRRHVAPHQPAIMDFVSSQRQHLLRRRLVLPPR